jgi:hypothetical protein
MRRERSVPDSSPALQHFQHFRTCDARAKKAVAINSADMGDLVADRGGLADSRLKPLLPGGSWS